MTKPEFQAEIKTLASCFPKFRPESWKELYGGYYQHLYAFPALALKWACKSIIQDDKRGQWGTAADKASDFPTAAELFDLCRVYMREQAHRRELAVDWPGYKLIPHECDESLKGRTHGKFTPIRSALFKMANADLAIHVKCQEPGKPVCPKCGAIQEPWENPLLKGLIEMFPEQTKGWSSWHHGYLLCRGCEQYGASS